MNKEEQLEKAVSTIREFEVPKAPPVFELYAALVALSIAILLLLLPGVFEQNDGTFYVLMRSVLPQGGWTIVFFLGGMISAVGMLLESHLLRTVALLFLTLSYGIVAAFYIVTFPNLAGIMMFWTTIFTASSVPLVRQTAIRSTDKLK